MSKEILIVDDEADIRMLTSGILNDEGYETREAGKSDEALKALERRRPNLVLLDIWLQGSELDGLQVLRHIKKTTPHISCSVDVSSNKLNWGRSRYASTKRILFFAAGGI